MKLKITEFAKYKTYIILGGILLLFLLLFGGMFLVHAASQPEENEKVEVTLPPVTEVEEEPSKQVVVDVKGAVVNPGVYHLSDTSYVYQAIDAAGGLLETANTSLLNLSKKLTDSMVVIVYTNAEIEALRTSEKEIQYIEIEVPCVCPDTMNDACIEDTKPSEVKDTKISLNKATLEDLLQISGIGESKAQAILTYRKENGEFKSIDDVKNVSGIGDALFEKIKDQITV